MIYEKDGIRMYTNIETGLSTEEAKKRIQLFNEKEHTKFDTQIFLYSSTVVISIVITILSGGLKNLLAGVCALAVTLSFLFLLDYSTNYTTVVRDGKKKKIHVNNLTIGDIVYLRSGMAVPADGKVVFEKNLHICYRSGRTYRKTMLKEDCFVITNNEIIGASDLTSDMVVAWGSGIMLVTKYLGERWTWLKITLQVYSDWIDLGSNFKG